MIFQQPEPPRALQLGAGQPQLMSRMSAPISSAISAAMRIRSGWPQKSGPQTALLRIKPIWRLDFGLLRVKPSTEINSDTLNLRRRALSRRETRRPLPGHRRQHQGRIDLNIANFEWLDFRHRYFRANRHSVPPGRVVQLRMFSFSNARIPMSNRCRRRFHEYRYRRQAQCLRRAVLRLIAFTIASCCARNQSVTQARSASSTFG